MIPFNENANLTPSLFILVYGETALDQSAFKMFPRKHFGRVTNWSTDCTNLSRVPPIRYGAAWRGSVFSSAGAAGVTVSLVAPAPLGRRCLQEVSLLSPPPLAWTCLY